LKANPVQEPPQRQRCEMQSLSDFNQRQFAFHIISPNIVVSD
jgi:hypothetical protein